MLIVKAATGPSIPFFMADVSDRSTGLAGIASFAINLLSTAGVYSLITPVITEVGAGYYALQGVAGYFAGEGFGAFHIEATGAVPLDLPFEVSSYKEADIYSDMAKDSTVMKAASYTAPDNAGIAAVKAKTDGLPANTSSELDAIDAQLALVKAKTDLLPANLITQLDASDAAIADMKADILVETGAVRAKTDALPASTSSELDAIDAQLALVKAKTDQLSADTYADLTAIKAKTDALPADTTTRLTNIDLALAAIPIDYLQVTGDPLLGSPEYAAPIGDGAIRRLYRGDAVSLDFAVKAANNDPWPLTCWTCSLSGKLNSAPLADTYAIGPVPVSITDALLGLASYDLVEDDTAQLTPDVYVMELALTNGVKTITPIHFYLVVLDH